MSRVSFPKVVQDITSGRRTVFRSASPRVNLSYRKRTFSFTLSPIAKCIAVACAAWLFFLSSAIAPTTSETLHAFAKSPSEEERASLEAQLQDLENQINQYQGQIDSYKKQGKTLTGEITRLNDTIAKINLQIKAVTIKLSELNSKISETQGQITVTEGQIASNRDALGRLVRNLYVTDQDSGIEIFLKYPNLSDFFGNLHTIGLLQGSLRTTISEITTLRDQLQDHKEQLAIAKADTETIRRLQAQQKAQTDQLKKEKAGLLQETKGQEAKYQDILKKTRAAAAAIRTRLFELYGGGELTFEQAYQYAQMASNATGVRAAFILAVLHRESALGRNVGKCTYQQSMNPSEQPTFLQLLSDLNIKPETVSVSCANADGAYGGAMGPAQFLPSTWKGYASKISSITGHTPPSPWNNADAFVAAGLYLKDAGATTNEKQAAAAYYCGRRWKRYVCLNVYGAKVVEQAASFQDDIDAITKN